MRSAAIMFALATVLVIASDASATNGKNYVASQCVAWQGAWSFGTGAGSIVNASSTNWLGVDCPAVKDEATAVRPSWLKVLDRNNTSNADVACRLFAAHTSGSTVVSASSELATSTNSSNWQVLTTPVTFPIATDPADAYFFSCSVPPVGAAASGIQAYHVEED